VDLSVTPGVLDAARSVDPARYAIGGRTPASAVRPTSRDEVAEVLRAASGDRRAVVPWGGGTELARMASPERYDLALDLTALDSIVEYEPEDLTLTAECGITLETLRARLAIAGQELPLEAPQPARATLGGVLATNASGPRRRRFGAPRDRILGARFALSDGTLARTGGRVVKNVAGYGIHRLLCGSRGGLGVIVEASLKLLPAPSSRAVLVYAARASEMADATRWAFLSRLEPAIASVVVGAEALGAASHGADALATTSITVVVGLEDDAPWVAQQEQAVRRALGDPLVRLDGDAAARLGAALCELGADRATCLTLTTARTSPAAIEALATRTPAAPAVFHAPSGLLRVFPERDDARRMAADLVANEFELTDVRGVGDMAPATSPLASTSGLRERIRAALDPSATLAFGPSWARK
jgi:FAD/FMN-containing dehydrogenase